MVDEPPAGFPPPPPPPPKKKMSGCVLALVISGALMLVLIVGFGIAAALFFQSDRGKATMATVNVAMKSREGPGPDALRAAGCAEALALSYDAMNEAAKPILADAGPEAAKFFEQTGVEVRCMDPKGPMTCEDVGRIYAGAANPAGEFSAVVSANAQDRCRVTVLADGTPKPHL